MTEHMGIKVNPVIHEDGTASIRVKIDGPQHVSFDTDLDGAQQFADMLNEGVRVAEAHLMKRDETLTEGEG